MAEKALKEAEYWLRAAKNTLESAESEEAYTVCIAQAIHSIIKANDALTIKYLGETAHRHDDAPELFQKLIVRNKIPSEEASYREIIMRAAREKSKFNYKGTPASKANAKVWLNDAGKFLKMTKKYVNSK
ncbi:MAG: HEPN domain-containing protein [Candidatus Thermoplasmatota archaeon]|nr:HEPN domain-containing protein [Candidatus Thermoplasmatota archaeon]